jgi:hypothetical protein
VTVDELPTMSQPQYQSLTNLEDLQAESDRTSNADVGLSESDLSAQMAAA